MSLRRSSSVQREGEAGLQLGTVPSDRAELKSPLAVVRRREITRPEAIMLLFPLLFYSALLSILPIYSPIFCPLFCSSPIIIIKRTHDNNDACYIVT